MKNILRIILLLLFASVSVATFSQTVVKKSEEIVVRDGNSYFKHVIRAGETMYAISKAYNVSVDALKKSNPGVSSLSIGQILYVPQESESQGCRHIVTLGETLFSISRKYNTTPDVLREKNAGVTNALRVGQVLKVPCEGEVPVKSTNTLQVENTPESKPSTSKVSIKGETYIVHKVKKGETLYALGKLYNVPTEVIVIENPAVKDGLKEGVNLRIPFNKEFKEQEYILHRVKKGETLYAISREYNVQQDQLVALNPAVKSGLREGYNLKVPFTEENINAAEQKQTKRQYYEVKAGDTFYSIARKFNISPKKIKKANPYLKHDALAVGSVIYIPGIQPMEYRYIASPMVDSIVTADSLVMMGSEKLCCDSLKADTTKVVRFALMLPFYLKANDTMDLSENILKRKERVFPASESFLEFYQGVLLALDDLRSEGYKVEVQVYDTERDTNTVKNLLKKIDFQKIDFVIGPVYENTFKIVAKHAEKYSKLVISPLSANTSVLRNSSNAVVVNTPQLYRVQAVSLFVSQLKDYNFLIVHNGRFKELETLDDYKETIYENVPDSNYFKEVALKELNLNELGTEGIENALSPVSKNVVIVPSSDQAFVNDVVTKLYKYHKKFDIVLFGMAIWETYENLELEYLFNMNLHFSTTMYVDYALPEVKEFVMNYRSNFKTEPSRYSFQGYDLTKFWVSTKVNYGANLNECLTSANYNGLQTKFSFLKGENEGYSNVSTSILYYTPEVNISSSDFDVAKAIKKYNVAKKHAKVVEEEEGQEPSFNAANPFQGE